MTSLIKPSSSSNTLLGIRNATQKHWHSNFRVYKPCCDSFVKRVNSTESAFSCWAKISTILASVLSFVGIGGAANHRYINNDKEKSDNKTETAQNINPETTNKSSEKESKEKETTQDKKKACAAVYNCSRASAKPDEKKDEEKQKNYTDDLSKPRISNASVPPKKKSNNNQTKTPTVVKAQQVTFKGPLSMEPTKFIAEIWDEFIETLGENGDKDIRKFLSQPKVLNRLAANRNKKMQEYFKKKAEKGLADNKIIQKYKSSENLNNDEISDIFNERVEELGFSEKKPTCKFDDNPSMFFGIYDHKNNQVFLYTRYLKNDIKITINTIFHELTHAKQHALVWKYFDLTNGITFKSEKIEDLKKLSQDDQITLLAMLLAQCQYDYTFTNGCDSTKTVQLCDYKNLNNEVEAFAFGDEAAKLIKGE